MSEYPVLDVRSIPELVSSVGHHSFFAQITPFVATEITKKYNYHNQRVITKSRVSLLSAAMIDGSFEPISTIIFSVESDKIQLVDGQHTLQAIISSNTTWALPIIVSRNSANRMYPKIDRNKNRSLKDAVRAGSAADTMNLAETNTLRVAVGIKMILNGYSVSGGIRNKFISEDKIIDVMIKEYQLPAHRLYEIVAGLTYGKKLTARIPMAILLTLYKELPQDDLMKIDEFIYGCATNINLGAGDTRRLVYTMYTSFLRTVGNRNVHAMSRDYEAANLLSCWHYWYHGDTHEKNFNAKQLNSLISRKPNLTGTHIYFPIKMQ